MFADGQGPDEEILLLDVGGHAGDAAADAAAVHTHVARHQQVAPVTICQHVQQCRLTRTTVDIRSFDTQLALELIDKLPIKSIACNDESQKDTRNLGQSST